MITVSNCMIQILRQLFEKIFDEYTQDVGVENRSTNQSGADSIQDYPVYLISGAAGRRVKELLKDRIQVDRKSVKALRFAGYEVNKVKYNHSTEASYKGGNDDIAVDDDDDDEYVAQHERDPIMDLLNTISFKKSSGLESQMPIIIDGLMDYVKHICKRTIFRKAFDSNMRHQLNEHENSTLRKAVCVIYTVLTRCRGPCIWIETDKEVDSHPLITALKKHLEDCKIRMSFISDIEFTEAGQVKRIDDLFVRNLFVPGANSEDFNASWEVQVREFLSKVQISLRKCIKEYEGYHRQRTPDTPLESMNELLENVSSLETWLNLSNFPEVAVFLRAMNGIPSLFRAHKGIWVRAYIPSST
jgi:hypothetical protein